MVDFSIIATNNSKKESAKWAKISNSSYIFYVLSDKPYLFSFENEKFFCKSEAQLCKEIE